MVRGTKDRESEIGGGEAGLVECVKRVSYEDWLTWQIVRKGVVLYLLG